MVWSALLSPGKGYRYRGLSGMMLLLMFAGILSAQTRAPVSNIEVLEQKFAEQPTAANADALSRNYFDLGRTAILHKQPDSLQWCLNRIRQSWQRVKPQSAFTKAKSFSDIGHFYAAFKRDYGIADSFYQLANPWVFKTDSIDFMVLTQLRLANVYVNRGFKQKGADLIQKWADKVENIAHKQTKSYAFHELRSFYEAVDIPGAAERAVYYFERDFAIAKEMYGPNNPMLLAYYCQMETRYENAGNIDSALILLKILEDRIAEVDMFRQVWVLLVGASIYLKINDIQTSKKYLNRVWPMVQANHLEGTDDGQFIMFLMGRVAHLEGRLEEAEAYCKQALETCRKADFKSGKIDVLKELVVVTEKLGKYRDQARYQKELSETEELLTKESYSKAIAEVETELKLLEKDGRIREQEATQRLLWLGLGLAALVTMLSVWFYWRLNKERRALAASNRLIDRQNKELTNLNEAKTRFFTNISHEFRTPLTVILGMTEQLKNSVGVTHSHADTTHAGTMTRSHADIEDANTIALIQRNGQNLLRLINQILDLSKLDSGLLGIHWQRGNIIVYLQYLTESFYSMAQEREVRLVFYAETEYLEMDYDLEKTQAIVTNLLSNALKFTARGGKVVLHAKVVPNPATGSEPPECLQLIVQDTGKGIPQSELSHIFDRFYQVDDSGTRRGEGTGIGLAYVKELTALLGGSIAVESVVGKGSTFTLLLPIRRTAQWMESPAPTARLALSDTPVTIQPEQSAAPVATTNTLLIIEDNADVVAYLRSLLQADYQIEWAPDGQTGIEKAIETVPDIIISDVMMPEKDGYEVCYTLKNDERTSHIPIILLTAKATQADKLTGLRTGADAYIEKPFHREELLVRLEKLLELRAKLQARYAQTILPKVPVPVVSTPGNSTPAPTLDELFLQKIHNAVVQKMDDPELGILQLCHATRLSHTQMFRKLKALTGENPTQYIRRMRLERGLELLKTTQLNVSEVAYEVGFNDPNYFSRAFQEQFGKTPNAMRK